MLLFNSCVVGLLLLLFFQDLKNRAISWLPLFFIFLLLFAKSFLVKSTIYGLLGSWCFNIAFIVLELLTLYLYYAIRNKRFIQLTDSMLGWGDILFWLAAALAFSEANFIVFFFMSLVFSLLAHLCFSSVFPAFNKKIIPLAGFQSLLLAGLVTADHLDWVNLYNDKWILSLLTEWTWS